MVEKIWLIVEEMLHDNDIYDEEIMDAVRENIEEFVNEDGMTDIDKIIKKLELDELF